MERVQVLVVLIPNGCNATREDRTTLSPSRIRRTRRSSSLYKAALSRAATQFRANTVIWTRLCREESVPRKNTVSITFDKIRESRRDSVRRNTISLSLSLFEMGYEDDPTMVRGRGREPVHSRRKELGGERERLITGLAQR